GGASALATARSLVIAGAASSAGPAIVTSAAADDPRLAVAYVRAADLFPSGGAFLGTPVNPTDVLLRTTLRGDVNLDGVVDFSDLVKLAQNYNTTVSETTDSWWTHGDFTGDGITDFNDLVKLAQNYNASLTQASIPGASAA